MTIRFWRCKRLQLLSLFHHGFLLARFLRDVVSSFLSLLYIHLLLTLSLLSLSLYVWFFKVIFLSRFDSNFLFQQLKITKKWQLTKIFRVLFSFCSEKLELCSNFLFWLNEVNEIVFWILLFYHEKTSCILKVS